MADLASGTTLVALTANVTAAQVAALELPGVRVEKGIAADFRRLSESNNPASNTLPRRHKLLAIASSECRAR